MKTKPLITESEIRDWLIMLKAVDYLSLRDISQMCGVSVSTLSRLLRRVGEPDLKTIKKLHRYIKQESPTETKKKPVLLQQFFKIAEKNYIFTITEA